MQQGVFSTSDDEFIIEPLWNETETMTVSDDDDDDDARAADAGIYHVIYRRSALHAAAVHSAHHCGLRGLYSLAGCFGS